MPGYKQTLQMIRHGKGKLVILINNCPVLWKSDREYYTMLAKAGVTTVAIILNWAQHVGNTTENVHCLSLIQVIMISLEAMSEQTGEK